MILGIVSDTHGHIANSRAAARMLESLGIDELIHCGDIGSADVVAVFSGWPVHYVFGNVDVDKRALGAAISAAGQTPYGHFAELERLGKNIALMHGHDERRLKEAIH